MVMKPYNFNKGGVQMATFQKGQKDKKQLTVEQLNNIGSANLHLNMKMEGQGTDIMNS